MKTKFWFTAEWGTWTGYFAEKYLARYDFSGHLEIENGTVLKVERIHFPKDAWGPFVFSKQFSDYGKTDWESHVCNWFDGIRVTAEAEDGTVFRIVTNTGSVTFTPHELNEKGHIMQHVGGRYSMAIFHIEPALPSWRTASLRPGETRMEGSAFSGRQADMFGVRGVILPPGGKASGKLSVWLPEKTCESDCVSVNCLLRFLISESPDGERRARGLPNFIFRINGKDVYQNRKFATYHDTNSQFLEEVPFRLPGGDFLSGANRAELINLDKRFSVLVPMIRFMPEIRHHMQVVACPKWILAGKPFRVVVFCGLMSAKLSLEYDPDLFEDAMPETDVSVRHQTYRGKLHPIPDNEEFLWEGEHEFFFKAKRAFQNGKIRFTDLWSGSSSEAVVKECWPVGQEPVPVKTGVEIKTGTPWEYHEYIRRILDGQLGNLVVFRDYHNRFTHWQKLWEAAAECRKNGLYVDAVSMKDQNIVASAAADKCLCTGGHECTGIFYGSYAPQNLSRTMRDAQAASISILRSVAESYRIPGVPVATGDASVGSRNAYLAGFDILRHETFVAHHLLILPNARGCAKAFHRKIWGVHIATQHNAQPELSDGLRRFWLGFFLPWVMGANFLFEEDSLFLCFKYYRMVGDDELPRRKRELCAAFHKYSQTHPRSGKPQVDIAVLQGRFAPPFSGISTTNYDDPSLSGVPQNEDFPVWGMCGCCKWEWGYRQPEKGYHLLELLAPGICLNPLNQDAAKVRRFFSGDPRGEFDFLPVEADPASFSDYQLTLLLDWHTMEPQTEQQGTDVRNDYEKFLRYAQNGGTLFLSVPQLTTRADRGFLKDMDDLRLIYGGDVADLCGVRIHGKSGVRFSSAAGEADFSGFDLNRHRDLLRRPNTAEDEDGPCMLADVEPVTAETVVSDTESGKPLVVRSRVGKGFVYLLCTYAYPGHEALRTFMPNLLDALISRHVSRSVSVEDSSGDVYWSVWKTQDGAGKIYLLNTDWTSAGNCRTVTVKAGGIRFPFHVCEGRVGEISFTKTGVLFLENGTAGLTQEKSSGGCASFSLDGFGKADLFAAVSRDCRLSIDGKDCALKASDGFYRFVIDFDAAGHYHIPVSFLCGGESPE